MAWCQGYAFQNRKFMLDLMVDSVNQVTGASPNLKDSVNIHHNYCQCERCQYTVSSAKSKLHPTPQVVHHSTMLSKPPVLACALRQLLMQCYQSNAPCCVTLTHI